MSKIVVQVEFLAGTDIKEAVTEARQKAIQWDVAYVRFKFNGYSFSIRRGCNVDSVVKEFMEAKPTDPKNIVR